MKQDETKSAHLVSISNNKSKRLKRKKEKGAASTALQKKQQNKSVDQGKNNCFLYGAKGYKKKYCTNYHVWCANKSILLNLVCSKVNLISVPRHTW